MLVEPLSTSEAKRLIRAILVEGTLTFTKHALAELAADNLEPRDAENVLRGGVCEAAEFENGSWRYRFRTAGIVVVVAFRSESAAVVVTGWRMKP